MSERSFRVEVHGVKPGIHALLCGNVHLEAHRFSGQPRETAARPRDRAIEATGLFGFSGSRARVLWQELKFRVGHFHRHASAVFGVEEDLAAARGQAHRGGPDGTVIAVVLRVLRIKSDRTPAVPGALF